MRIMVLSTDSGSSVENLRKKEDLLKTAVGSDVEITVDCQHSTHICVDSAVDIVITGAETIQRALKAQDDGYDAVCLYCGSDPAYDACRELLDIPVIGAAHAAFSMAMCLGYQYSFITTSNRRIPQKTEYARSCGIDITRLVSVRSIEYDMSAEHERSKTIEMLAKISNTCALQDGADTVILGCLSFAGMAKEVSLLSGVSVIDPAFAMITMAEAVCRQGLSHSKVAYPCPPAADRSWGAGELNTGRNE